MTYLCNQKVNRLVGLNVCASVLYSYYIQIRYIYMSSVSILCQYLSKLVCIENKNIPKRPGDSYYRKTRFRLQKNPYKNERHQSDRFFRKTSHSRESETVISRHGYCHRGHSFIGLNSYNIEGFSFSYLYKNNKNKSELLQKCCFQNNTS